MRRVVQDAFNEGHPWFEIEPDKFTCAKNWEAALERRERQPQGAQRPILIFPLLTKGRGTP